MTAKNLIISGSAIPATPLDSSIITEEYFIKRFADFLPQYISRGRPAAETLRKYISEIKRFLAWCFANNCPRCRLTII